MLEKEINSQASRAAQGNQDVVVIGQITIRLSPHYQSLGFGDLVAVTDSGTGRFI
jgi:hypothetical protein